MATVPNRYYNSPWIAQAGENLAAALAPPDPTKLLERQKLQFEIDRQKAKALQEDTDRADVNEADEALAKIAEMPPIMDPKTGKPDWVATEKQVRGLMSTAFRKGGIDYVKPAMTTAGPAAPSYAAAAGLENVKGGIRSNLADQNLSSALQLAGLNFANTQKRDAAQNAFTTQRDAELFKYRMQLAAAEQEGRLEELRLKIKEAHGNPLTISGQVLRDITNHAFTKIKQAGLDWDDVDPDVRNQLISNIAVRVSSGRNVPTAVLETFNSDAELVTEPSQSYFGMEFGGGKSLRLKQGVPALSTGLGDPSAAGAGGTPQPNVTVPTGESAPPAAPAPAPATPPPASAPLGAKSAVPMKVISGQQVYVPRNRADYSLLEPGDAYLTPTGEITTKKK